MRILILGRQDLIQDLLARFLKEKGFEIVAQEKDPNKAIEIIKGYKQPDIVLIDANQTNGKEPALIIKSKFPYQKIVVLSHLEEKEEVLSVLSLGVEGYLIKSSHPEEIIEDLIAINEGENRVSRKLYHFVLKDWQEKQKRRNCWHDNTELTSRELEVLELMAEGKTNKEISEILFISPNTVKCHVSSIISKLNANSRTDAVFKGYRLLRDKRIGDSIFTKRPALAIPTDDVS